MAESVTLTYTDPSTGQPVKGTLKRMPTPAELAALKQHYGEVTVAPVTQKEKILGVQKTKPDAKKALTDLGEIAGYAALGFVPEAKIAGSLGSKWLAAHPELVGKVARSLGASGIAGTGAAVKDEDVGKAAKGSGLVQAFLEAVMPSAFKFGARVGGRAMRRTEDEIGTELMTKIKTAVPWFKSLKNSHEGLNELLVGGKGPELLSKNYGQALQAVKNAVPETERMTLSVEDALALKIPSAEIEAVVPPAYAGKGITVEQAQAMNLPVSQVRVPTRSVITHVSGAWKKDPGLNQRTLAAIDAALPDVASKEFTEARRLYREGTNFIKSLKATHAIDERTGRVSAERLTMGSRALFGEPGKAGTSIAEQYKAPEASKIIQEATPKGKAPHAVGPGKAYVSPTGHMGIGGHGGGESVQSVLTQTQPSVTLFSENIPLSKREEAIKKFVPGAVHALTKQQGVTP